MPTDFILDAIETKLTVVVTTRDRSHHGHILAVDDKGILLDYKPGERGKATPPVYLTWAYIDWIARAE